MTKQMLEMLEAAQPGFGAWNAARLTEEARVRKATDRSPDQVLATMNLHTLIACSAVGKVLFETHSWQNNFPRWPEADRNAVWSALHAGQFNIDRKAGTIAVTVNTEPVPADWLGYELLVALG